MKRVFAILISAAVIISCLLGMTACHFDSNVNLEDDSKVKAVTVEYADGAEIELDRQDIDIVIGDIKRNLDNFQSDSKILVNKKWEYEYDYVFKITAVRRVMLSKKDITLVYRFGTTGIYTDGNGKKSRTRYDKEWTHLIAGARWICDATDSNAEAIRTRMEALKAEHDAAKNEAYEKNYNDMMSLFEDRGYTVRNLEEYELSYLVDLKTNEYVWLNAKKAFEATDTDTGDCYKVYWSNEKDAKEAVLHFGNEVSSQHGVFFGYSLSSHASPMKDVFSTVFVGK